MIQLNNISIFVSANGRALVRDISLTLNAGDKTVIIGEEGNGKSTLLKLIFDPALIAQHAEFTGSINRGGHRIGYLSQELTADEKALPVCDFLAAEDETWRLEYLASLVGLDERIVRETRPIGTLSGGERVKVRLVKILKDEPDMLLLDEPTNDIDIETLEWLEDFIERFEGGVLFVSHDETLIENTASAVIHLEHIHHKKYCRHTVANVPYREYIASRTSAMEHQEQIANKQREQFEKKEARWREIYEKVDSAQKNVSRGDPSTGRLLKKKMHSVMSQGRRLEKEREELTEAPVSERQIFIDLPSVELPPKKEMLRLDTDALFAPDGRRLTGRVKLDVDAGEHIVIVGKNGTGKTTLLRTIERELAPRRDIRLFYMPQDYLERLCGDITPVEYLAPSGERLAVTKARTYLGSVRFTADEAESAVKRLSGGQKAKLMFVKLALDGYNVLLLDEPTRNFSPLSTPVIRRILAGFGGCIISVSHDRKYIKEVASKVYRLDENGLAQTRI